MRNPVQIEAGRIVISKAGRDRGTAYAVLGLPSEDRVLVADGRSRTCDHPKKKNVRHLAAKPERIPELAGSPAAEPRRLDEAIRRGLKAAGYLAT